MADSSVLRSSVWRWTGAGRSALIAGRPIDYRALIVDDRAPVAHHSAIADRHVPALTRTIMSATALHKAMLTPAMRIAVIGPRPDAKEDAVIEVARAIVSRRRASVGGIAVVAIRAGGRRPAKVNADGYLGIDHWSNRKRKEQSCCKEKGFQSTHHGTFRTGLRFQELHWICVALGYCDFRLRSSSFFRRKRRNVSPQ